MYQKSVMKAHDKKFCLRQFHEGELVLKKILLGQRDSCGKRALNWERPYVVQKSFSGGALIMAKMCGHTLPNLVNADNVKKYYVKKKLKEKKRVKMKSLKLKTRKGQLR